MVQSGGRGKGKPNWRHFKSRAFLSVEGKCRGQSFISCISPEKRVCLISYHPTATDSRCKQISELRQLVQLPPWHAPRYAYAQVPVPSISVIILLFLQLASRFSGPLLTGKSYRFVYLHQRGVAILENTRTLVVRAHSIQSIYMYILWCIRVCWCHALREQEQLQRAQKEPQTASAAATETAAVTALVSSRDRGPPARRTNVTTMPCPGHRQCNPTQTSTVVCSSSSIAGVQNPGTSRQLSPFISLRFPGFVSVGSTSFGLLVPHQKIFNTEFMLATWLGVVIIIPSVL